MEYLRLRTGTGEKEQHSSKAKLLLVKSHGARGKLPAHTASEQSVLSPPKCGFQKCQATLLNLLLCQYFMYVHL